MRLYSIDVKPHDGYTDPFVHWVATQKEAKAYTQVIRFDYPNGDVTWHQREVPTTRPELLRWLNHRFSKK